MKARTSAPIAVRDRRRALISALAARVPGMQVRALAADPAGLFPAEDIEALRDLGALSAPLPQSLGGLGLGTEADAALFTMDALRLLGQGSLTVGRIFEAHVNALRLIIRYGRPAQAWEAAEDALAGHLFGLWVTDSVDAPVSMSPHGLLRGAKDPCSAAGHATRALITVHAPAESETIMTVVALEPGTRADLSNWDVHGMRASASGRITLDGLQVSFGTLGAPGDYLRQPDFSAGAWRASAVAFGGMEALVESLVSGLSRRGRDADPHQRARIGRALIARESARMWLRRAALTGEMHGADPELIANTVNMARIAIEEACLDVIRLVQQSLGMGSLRRGFLPELLFRDLATYLRQPAADETLASAAAYFAGRPPPPLL